MQSLDTTVGPGVVVAVQATPLHTYLHDMYIVHR